MLKLKPGSRPFHSYQMVLLYAKEYARLSITIVLSFTLLLSYLMISDSYLYNQIKDLIYVPEEVLVWQPYHVQSDMDPNLYQTIIDQISNQSGTSYVLYGEQAANLQSDYQWAHGSSGNYPVWLYSIGNASFFDYYHLSYGNYEKRELLLGRLELVSDEEVIIDESMYRFFGYDPDDQVLTDLKLTIEIDLRVAAQQVESVVVELDVVGIVSASKFSKESYTASMIHQDPTNTSLIPFDIFVDQGLSSVLDPSVMPSVSVYSEVPEQISTLSQELSLGMRSAFAEKQAVRDEIESSIYNKAVLSLFLFLLLALNISGNFQNLIESRKQEIGIKRALGLSRYRVIRQFTTEMVIVVGLCLAIAAWISMVVSLCVKLYSERVLVVDYTIYLTRFSVLLFLIITIGITAINCIMVAYKAGSTEIIRFIKSES